MNSRIRRLRRGRARALGLVVIIIVALGLIGTTLATTHGQTDAAPTSAVDASPTHLLYPVPVSIIGDSFTTGTSMGGLGGFNWTKQLGLYLEQKGIGFGSKVDAQSAAGYIVRGPGGTTYADQVRQTVTAGDKLVIIFGGRNDGPLNDTAAAAATYAEVRRIAPKTTLMVVGPAWRDENPPRIVTALRDSIRAPALAAGAIWIDPIADGWFTGKNKAVIGADTVHPTDSGHKLMALKMLDPVRQVIGRVKDPGLTGSPETAAP